MRSSKVFPKRSARSGGRVFWIVVKSGAAIVAICVVGIAVLWGMDLPERVKKADETDAQAAVADKERQLAKRADEELKRFTEHAQDAMKDLQKATKAADASAKHLTKQVRELRGVLQENLERVGQVEEVTRLLAAVATQWHRIAVDGSTVEAIRVAEEVEKKLKGALKKERKRRYGTGAQPWLMKQLARVQTVLEDARNSQKKASSETDLEKLMQLASATEALRASADQARREATKLLEDVRRRRRPPPTGSEKDCAPGFRRNEKGRCKAN